MKLQIRTIDTYHIDGWDVKRFVDSETYQELNGKIKLVRLNKLRIYTR